MSYACASALQAAIYRRLMADPSINSLVGSHIYDAMPGGTVPPLYVTLGAEKVRDASDATGAGAWHDLTIAVVTSQPGFQAAKDVAVSVSDALENADLTLDRGRLVALRFLRAEARREKGALRRIDLTFRARVENS